MRHTTASRHAVAVTASAVFTVLMALAGPGPTRAEAGLPTQAVTPEVGGAIGGRVVDPAGLGVRGTTVTARDAVTGFTRSVVTTETGIYRIEGLPSGSYTVSATASGYASDMVSGIVVRPGAGATANFTLKPMSRQAIARATGMAFTPRVEFSARLGWVLSDGVSGDEVLAADGDRYNRVDPRDSLSWGFGIGGFVTEHVEFEFLFARQSTTLEASGARTVEIGDLDVDTYHGVYAYNMGPGDASWRPYVFFGLGATRYGDVSFTAQGQLRTLAGSTRFSTTFGGGVKAYVGVLGVRLEGRVTPTNINSETTGWWCDPWWGCYAVGNLEFANQFEISGGLSLRF